MTAAHGMDVQRRLVDEIRRALSAEFAMLADALDALASGRRPDTAAPGTSTESGLDTLAALFGLDAAERTVLRLAAAAELEPQVAARIAKHGPSDRPDVALALRLAPSGGWEALCPEAPLRRWRLVELRGTGPFLSREISVDERVLHFLMGVNYLDARLEGLLTPIEPAATELSAREREAVDRLADAWRGIGAHGAPVLLIAGRDPAAKRRALAAAAATAGLRLYCIDGADIPDEWTARTGLAIYSDRELALSGGALLIECRSNETAAAAARLADAMTGPVAIAAPDPIAPDRAPRLRLDLAMPGREERRDIWRRTIGPAAEALGGGLDRLSEQFSLDRAGMDAAIEIAVNGTAVPPEALFGKLWSAAREQGRQRLDGLAERIESQVGWDDLVLPREQLAQLHDIAAHVREAWRVHQVWGWAKKGARGLGAASLFAGPSGTGKTLAAEVLAGALALDLYRIDLSQVVSKYIGETEKNLARIFAAAEDGGAILLFDEADALFGKRSEVKDSHDRYANVEVSFLLQRMEAYRGLAVLTTNQKSALDDAFLRRLRYVVTFPFPDAEARERIWARIFPDATPVEGLDPARLARLNLAGGSIRSIALNASFLAAGAATPVRAEHVLNAARREYAKLNKPFTASEAGAVA